MSKLSIRMTTKEFLIWIIFEAISIVSTIIIIDIYGFGYKIFLLPLFYCLLNIIFVRNFANRAIDNFPILLLHGFYFVRIVIAPLLWALSGIQFTFKSSINLDCAVWLMIYEMAAVYMVMYFNLNKKICIKQREIIINDRIFNRSKSLLLVLIIVLCVLLVMNPNAVLLYRSGLGFFNYKFTGFMSTDIIRQYSGSLVKKFGIVTFRYVFNITRILAPCIIALMMKYNKIRNNSITIVTILLTIVLNFIIMDDTIANSICYSLIILVFLSRLLNKKDFLTKSIAIAVGLVVLFFVARFMLSQAVYVREGISKTPIRYMSDVLQAYFSGFTNIGASLNMDNCNIFERLKYLIYEILRGVPYASTLFGLDETSLGLFFNKVNGSVGQIVPLLGASTFYFGKILSPLLSCVFVYLGINANINMLKHTNPLITISAITVSLYSTLAVSMYSLEIVCVGFFCIALPIYLIGKIIR